MNQISMVNLQVEETDIPKGKSSHLRDSMILELGRDLLNHSKLGNLQNVVELIQLGAPFTADWLGTSPLHNAVQLNNEDLAEVLLIAGIAQDARNKVDRTPLHIACQYGRRDLVKLLFAFKADPEVRDMLKMTPLHWAVESGDVKTVKIVLQHGCPINSVDKFGKTPMDIAQEKGDLEIIKAIQEMKDLSARQRNDIIKKVTLQSQNIGRKLLSKSLDFRTAKTGLARVMAERKKREELRKDDKKRGIKRVMLHQGELLPGKEPKLSLDPLTTNISETTIEMLQEHGITMIEPDSKTVISSALESGQSVKLTEAGKLALMSSKPVTTIHVPKSTKMTIQVSKKTGNIMAPNPFKVNQALGSGGKIIAVKADDLLKMASKKKFIIRQPSAASSMHFLDGKLYTNLDSYIERLQEKKRNCVETIEKLRAELKSKEEEKSKNDLLLAAALQQKAEMK